VLVKPLPLRVESLALPAVARLFRIKFEAHNFRFIPPSSIWSYRCSLFCTGCLQHPFPRTDFWDALELDDISTQFEGECPSGLDSPPFPGYEQAMHEDSEELCHIPDDAFPELQHLPELQGPQQTGLAAPSDAGRDIRKHR
jgi:hypothetical protein